MFLGSRGMIIRLERVPPVGSPIPTTWSTSRTGAAVSIVLESAADDARARLAVLTLGEAEALRLAGALLGEAARLR